MAELPFRLSFPDCRNGKYHNRALGMNMVVERSTAEQVRHTSFVLSSSCFNCAAAAATAFMSLLQSPSQNDDRPVRINLRNKLFWLVQVRNKFQSLKQKQVETDPDLTVADGACVRVCKIPKYLTISRGCTESSFISCCCPTLRPAGTTAHWCSRMNPGPVHVMGMPRYASSAVQSEASRVFEAFPLPVTADAHLPAWLQASTERCCSAKRRRKRSGKPRREPNEG